MRQSIFWHTRLPVTPRAPLSGTLSCDMVVIGGGVAGLHAALHARKQGADVVVLDGGICGGGMSGRSSGFLTPDSELELDTLTRRFGSADAAELWDVASAGAELVRATAEAHGIDCDLRQLDSLYLGVGRGGAEDVSAEHDARTSLGLTSMLLQHDALDAVHPGGYAAAVTYDGTWAIDPFAYTRGLAAHLESIGVRIYEQSEVVGIDRGVVVTRDGRINAATIALCGGRLPMGMPAAGNDVLYHAQTFLAITEPLTLAQRYALFPRHEYQCWDTTLVYTYYRLTGDHRLLVGGGSPRTTFASHARTRNDVIKRVIRRLAKRFPVIDELDFACWWPGLIDVSRDLLAIAAPVPGNDSAFAVLGCAGLPWAAWCGQRAAGRLLGASPVRADALLRWDRPTLIPDALQHAVGKPAAFAVDVMWAKR